MQTWPAQMAKSAVQAALLPGQVAGGVMNTQPSQPGMWSDEDEARAQLTNATMMDRATDLGGMVMGGTSFSAPRGAIGAGPVIPGVTPSTKYARIPESPPSSLRDRYWAELYRASGGKDVNRIKLTPDRIEAAKREIVDRPYWPDDAYQVTNQSRQAQEFAKEAMRRGIDDVRVKYPDGSHGSVYVRIGDKGTVRFSDHPAPMNGSEMVGGYSKTLGRRHGAASLSVSPYDSDYSAAVNWLRTPGATRGTP